MKIKALIPALVIASTLAAPAFAQTNGPVSQGGQPSTQKTRAQVHHELIQAQQDGQIARLNSTVYHGA
ncbi:MAG: hypothetical protein QOH33_2112 [Paraburkholderia sp.]|jgi:hypothetical protein|nr:hypothetical protein [Paraburkholderia sp.]